MKAGSLRKVSERVSAGPQTVFEPGSRAIVEQVENLLFRDEAKGVGEIRPVVVEVDLAVGEVVSRQGCAIGHKDQLAYVCVAVQHGEARWELIRGVLNLITGDLSDTHGLSSSLWMVMQGRQSFQRQPEIRACLQKFPEQSLPKHVKLTCFRGVNLCMYFLIESNR